MNVDILIYPVLCRFPGGNVAFPENGHIPGINEQKQDGTIWRDYYKAQYPKWDNWLKLRREMDPNNVFMNEYWAAVFGIDIRSHAPDDTVRFE